MKSESNKTACNLEEIITAVVTVGSWTATVVNNYLRDAIIEMQEKSYCACVQDKEFTEAIYTAFNCNSIILSALSSYLVYRIAHQYFTKKKAINQNIEGS